MTFFHTSSPPPPILSFPPPACIILKVSNIQTDGWEGLRRGPAFFGHFSEMVIVLRKKESIWVFRLGLTHPNAMLGKREFGLGDCPFH